ncbi:MAG: pirin family protein [bacterium]
MNNIRKPERVLKSQITMEGAGVRLNRAFGYREVPTFDPFLLLDDIHSKNPDDYLRGFPWHPHRGIETVTYVLHGEVDHGDSIGNSGAITDGDVQWMTAGSGIIHQEMPRRTKGDFRALQLWVNLPAAHKMREPRYRGVPKGVIPEVTLDDGTSIRVIAGNYGGVEGPVKDIVRSPEYLDITLRPESIFTHPVGSENVVFAYMLSGEGLFNPEDETVISAHNTILFGSGGSILIRTGKSGVRFLLISGEPLGEPVAWRGPIVMNTAEELDRAFDEYRAGTFIKTS